MERIEYRVRPVTRYIVTRYHETEGARTGGVEGRGEYDNYDTAYAVAYALCKADHDRLGYSPGDERIQYPRHPVDQQQADPLDLGADALNQQAPGIDWRAPPSTLTG